MRRPPSNLDDFLTGGEATAAVVDPATSSAPRETESVKKPTLKTSKARPVDRKKKAVPETAEATDEIVSPQRPTAEGGAPPEPVPTVATQEVETAVEPTARPPAQPPEESMNRASERQRSRTVPGEAAPTVIMSVRVPIELRERLEDILAAYSGVTFSDLVIRGLQNMVQEVEDNHRNRTGQELPKRLDRPEFPL